MNKKYYETRETYRLEAIEWQNSFPGCNHSYEDLAEVAEYFNKAAKKYGLIRQFHENGII